MAYLAPIRSAVILFPLLALALTIPVSMYHYHKFGAITWAQELVLYSFFFYMLTAYFLVIMPLPAISSVTRQGFSGYWQPVPFGNLIEYYQKHGFSVTRTWLLNFLQSPTLRQLGFNVLLSFPFGAYLRYYFRCGWKKTLLFSFLLSLFYELTQLSGLYGIYSGPYRLFDADDLICNTLGGMLGFWLSPLFSSSLPDRKKLDNMAYHKSEKVTLFRRACGLLVDFLLSCIGFAALVCVLSFTSYTPSLLHSRLYGFLSWTIVLLWLCTTVAKGRTPGKAWCHLRIEDSRGNPAGPLRLLLRYLFLWVQLVGTQILADVLRITARQCIGTAHMALRVGALGAELVFYLFFIEAILKLFRGSTPFLYERLSGTASRSVFLEESAPLDDDLPEVEPLDEPDETGTPAAPH